MLYSSSHEGGGLHEARAIWQQALDWELSQGHCRSESFPFLWDPQSPPNTRTVASHSFERVGNQGRNVTKKGRNLNGVFILRFPIYLVKSLVSFKSLWSTIQEFHRTIKLLSTWNQTWWEYLPQKSADTTDQGFCRWYSWRVIWPVFTTWTSVVLRLNNFFREKFNEKYLRIDIMHDKNTKY